MLIYILFSNVFLFFFHLSSSIISPKLGFCVISSSVVLVIWITTWLPVAYCAEPRLFTLIFKIRHTFYLVYISPLSTLLSRTSFILLLSLSHPMLFYPVLSRYTSFLHSHRHPNDPSSFSAHLTLLQRTTANTFIFINRAIWFIHYLNLHMASCCNIHSYPSHHWRSDSFALLLHHLHTDYIIRVRFILQISHQTLWNHNCAMT